MSYLILGVLQQLRSSLLHSVLNDDIRCSSTVRAVYWGGQSAADLLVEYNLQRIRNLTLRRYEGSSVPTYKGELLLVH